MNTEHPPSNCRQRLASEGKAYPRSWCAACGQFSPRWRQCDAALASPQPAEAVGDDLAAYVDEYEFRTDEGAYSPNERERALILDALRGWEDRTIATLVADAEAVEQFAVWLEREMPPGTVISDPRWWAPRIACRLTGAPDHG